MLVLMVYNALLYLRGGLTLVDEIARLSAELHRIESGDNCIYEWFEYNSRLIRAREQLAEIAECPAGIIRFLEQRGGVNLMGVAGTNPETLAEFVNAQGYNAQLSYMPRYLDQQIRDADVSILLYGKVSSGFFIHYVMVRYVPGEDGEPGVFKMYGEFGGDYTYFTYSSVDRWLEIGRRGYINNEDILSGYTIFTVISISN